MEEAYAPKVNEPGWLSQQGDRLLNTIGTGLVGLGEKMRQARPEIQIERAESQVQETT